MATLLVPDIGDFADVAIIEILVKVGDTFAIDQSLLTVESDKASMEIPSNVAGTVTALSVKLGDKVSQGSVVLEYEPAEHNVAAAASAQPSPVTSTAPSSAPAASQPPTAPLASNASAPSNLGPADVHCDTLVLGAGPGGYTAAFRAADLGQKVVLVERYPSLGGVCLNVGCIPSKALLHSAKILTEAADMAAHGITFGAPKIDLEGVRGWKESVVGKLTGGLSGLAKGRKVQVVQGVAQFANAYQLDVQQGDKTVRIQFQHAIIAAGSTPVQIPTFPNDDPRLWDSTDALALRFIPKRLLVVGGGIIGLEMACVYDALGSAVTVVEGTDQLIPAADKDVVAPLLNRIKARYQAIHLSTKVTAIDARAEGLFVTFEGANGSVPAEAQCFDAVLVAVGRRPNGKTIAAEKAGVMVNERGFIPVDAQQRTTVAHIFAIGDICSDPMLAHKATTEAKIAAEVIAGHKVAFDASTIPSVAYTEPEIAWMGLTEKDAKQKGIAYEKASFPWAASGRALAMGAGIGLTKVLFSPDTHKLLGVSMVGSNAGELLAEGVLALEMGADLEDIALSIHAHPTLSETLAFAAEMGLGTITDLIPPKKKSS